MRLAAPNLLHMVRRLSALLCLGGVSYAYSEFLFWSSWRPGQSWGEMGFTVVAYAFLAYVAAFLVDHYRLRGWEGRFLAGAVFGWVGEGVLVQTMYELPPLSISFTGLAWHASITVLVGWFAVPRLLGGRDALRLTKWAAAAGLCWGSWALQWWVEDGEAMTVPKFAAYAFGGTAFLVAAYYGWARLWPPEPLGARPFYVVAALFACVFVLVTLALPYAPLVMLPVLVPTVLALRRIGARSRASLQETWPLQPLPRLRDYAALFAAPALALAVYAVASAASVELATGIVLYLVTVPLGFWLFGRALWRVFRSPHPALSFA